MSACDVRGLILMAALASFFLCHLYLERFFLCPYFLFKCLCGREIDL